MRRCCADARATGAPTPRATTSSGSTWAPLNVMPMRHTMPVLFHHSTRDATRLLVGTDGVADDDQRRVAHPRDGVVRTQAVLQSLSEAPQVDRARRRARPDVAEDEDGDAAVGPLGARDRDGDAVDEQSAEGQPRRRIAQRLVLPRFEIGRKWSCVAADRDAWGRAFRYQEGDIRHGSSLRKRECRGPEQARG